jgi:thiamine pyrophosphate-dependent acetolactate synthase large subunit-like protein
MTEMGWGSDAVAAVVRDLGFEYVALVPGSSFRGLHDSFVNYLNNEKPSMLVCLHEEHTVAIAHGYAKVTGKPMAVAIHSNVGLMHATMAFYDAWCDRAPVLVLGATGPIDAEKRRPWIDWIHTSRDQGAYIRSIIKWDDMPSSPQALVESMCRANIATRSAPTAPVYICLDAGLQEARLAEAPQWPDVARFLPPAPPRPAREAIARAAGMLADAARPVIMLGRGSRQAERWQPRIRLAERLGACVLTDLKLAAVFPTDHPAHHLPPFNVLPKPARELLAEADVILALDWVDLGGALRQARAAGPVSARIVAATLDQHLHTGANMEHQSLPAVDMAMAADGDLVVEDLLEALGPASAKEPWKARPPAKAGAPTAPDITMEQIAATLRAEFNDPHNVSFCTLGRGWPIDIWPLQDGLAYLGKDGGGGLGSGPGLSVGAALALAECGRHPVAMLGDGDFCMGVTAIWTAVRHRIPLLVLVNNNRSYFNDELHQETVARTRGREIRNRWIGLRMDDPAPDIAKLAEAQGAVGIGPVRSPAEVKAAIARGVAVLKSGGVCVIDFHVSPPPERSDGIGHRATGA